MKDKIHLQLQIVCYFVYTRIKKHILKTKISFRRDKFPGLQGFVSKYSS